MTPVLATAFRRPSTLPLIQFTEIQKTTLSKPEGETAPELDVWYVSIFSSGIHILLKNVTHKVIKTRKAYANPSEVMLQIFRVLR